jgi:hypothetical protein
MIRDRLLGRKLEKIPEGERIGAAPLDAALAVDALEIPHEVYPKIPAGRNRGTPLLGIEGLAQLLSEGVEASFTENLLKPIVKSVPTGPRNLIPGQIHRPLLIALTAKPHQITSGNAMAGFSATWTHFSTVKH